MHTDTFDLIDEWGPEKVVCVSDRRTGMRGVLVIDNTRPGHGQGRDPDEPDADRARGRAAGPDHDLEVGGGRPVPRRREGRDPRRPEGPEQGRDPARLRPRPGQRGARASTCSASTWASPRRTRRSSSTSSATAVPPSACLGRWAACPTTSSASPATGWPRPPTPPPRAIDLPARRRPRGDPGLRRRRAGRRRAARRAGRRRHRVSTATGAGHRPRRPRRRPAGRAPRASTVTTACTRTAARARRVPRADDRRRDPDPCRARGRRSTRTWPAARPPAWSSRAPTCPTTPAAPGGAARARCRRRARLHRQRRRDRRRRTLDGRALLAVPVAPETSSR